MWPIILITYLSRSVSLVSWQCFAIKNKNKKRKKKKKTTRPSVTENADFVIFFRFLFLFFFFCCSRIIIVWVSRSIIQTSRSPGLRFRTRRGVHPLNYVKTFFLRARQTKRQVFSFGIPRARAPVSPISTTRSLSPWTCPTRWSDSEWSSFAGVLDSEQSEEAIISTIKCVVFFFVFLYTR